MIGAHLAGRTLAALLVFPPPLRVSTDYPRFSWIAAGLVLAPFVALAVAWFESSQRSAALAPRPRRPTRRFPIWGVLAAAWIGAWWWLAWTRYAWFAPLQRYTFFPLWLGFIVVTNAAIQYRTGSCLMTRSPERWVGLFVASAGFWWVFELLNRFGENWHYLGVSDYTAAGYALHASVCFSTVLPAVTAVAELLGTSGRWRSGCAAGPRLAWLSRRSAALVLIGIGVGGLIGLGGLPREFYPALWIAPLALLVAGSIFAGEGLPVEVARGDWHRAASWATAALGCGFFWELWNVQSAAKWIYTVPYVDGWHLFEMPVLGYLGYFAFGLECYYVAQWVLGEDEPFSSVSST
jgi:hypothetical protein